MVFTFSVKSLAADMDAIAAGDFNAVNEKRDLLSLVNKKQNLRNCFIAISDADIMRGVAGVHECMKSGWTWKEAADYVAADIAAGRNIDWCFA